MATTTTSDYTVECKIPKEVFDAFKKWDLDQNTNLA
jgi:hypothetical protein